WAIGHLSGHFAIESKVRSNAAAIRLAALGLSSLILERISASSARATAECRSFIRHDSGAEALGPLHRSRGDLVAHLRRCGRKPRCPRGKTQWERLFPLRMRE